jgi:hypothetical protein
MDSPFKEARKAAIQYVENGKIVRCNCKTATFHRTLDEDCDPTCAKCGKKI